MRNRGREFRWHVLDGAASEIAISEDYAEVARLVRVPDQSPTYLVDFGGRRWRIEHALAAIGSVFRIDDLDAGTVVGGSHYTREADLRLNLDDRTYSLRQSATASAWQDGIDDIVTFRADGRAYVLLACDPRDAPALLLLGIVKAVQNTLLPAIVSPF